MTMTAYIIFNGQCEEALHFYAAALNGEIKSLMRYENSPAEAMAKTKQNVIHAGFAAPGVIFMASDAGKGGLEASNSGMIHLSLNFNEVADLEKTFGKLSDGARITMPPQETFWGAKFGMLQDKFGINWMLNCERK